MSETYIFITIIYSQFISDIITLFYTLKNLCNFKTRNILAVWLSGREVV